MRDRHLVHPTRPNRTPSYVVRRHPARPCEEAWRHPRRRRRLALPQPRARPEEPGRPTRPTSHPPLQQEDANRVDDYSRVACAEIHDDETADTSAAVLRNAVDSFTDRGITVQRALSDNGSSHP
jgi:hypothetical protein